MNNKIFISVFSIILILTPSLSSQNKAIGVLPTTIISKNDEFDYLSEAITDSIIEAFLNNGYVVVERAKLARALEELEFQLSGLSSSDSVKIGNFIDASFLSISSLSIIENSFTLTIRLIEVETGRVFPIGKKIGTLDNILKLAGLIISESTFAYASIPFTYVVLPVSSGPISYEFTDMDKIIYYCNYSIEVNGRRFNLADYLYENRNSIEESINDYKKNLYLTNNSNTRIVFLVVFFPIYKSEIHQGLNVFILHNQKNIKHYKCYHKFQKIEQIPYFFYPHFDGKSKITAFRKNVVILNWNKDPIYEAIKTIFSNIDIDNIPYVIVDANKVTSYW